MDDKIKSVFKIGVSGIEERDLSLIPRLSQQHNCQTDDWVEAIECGE